MFELKILKNEGRSFSTDILFSQAVLDGLSLKNKYLPSWLIFDGKGSEIFSQIASSPEYLPAVCEKEILKTHSYCISKRIKTNPFLLVELGAGDGRKTKLLIDDCLKNKSTLHYYPIDISHGAILNLVEEMRSSYYSSQIKVTGLIGDYFLGLNHVPETPTFQKLVLFLGITLNNMSPKNAKLFLCRLNKNLNKKDLVLIGFDLKKNPKILYDSYNDSKGLFENLNLHLLERINKTLDANFNKDFFMHHSHYNPKSNALECYLYSTRNQTVRINLLKKEFHFKEWEAIQTEKSYKYSLDNIKILARKCDFKIIDCFYDSKKYFVVFLFETQKKSSKS